MKFNWTYPNVLALAVMLGAILLAYAFVSPAAAVITGAVNMILGAMFINVRVPDAPPDVKDAASKEDVK